MHKQITVSSEPKIIGVNNGVYQIELNKISLLNEKGNYYEFYKFFNSFSYWLNQDNIPVFDLLPLEAKKVKKAIMTDLLKYSPTIMAFKWLISERFYKILKDFNIGEHSLYEVKIEHSEEKFFFLKLKTITKDKFIFNKNILTVYKNGIDEEITFQDFDEYLKFMDVNPLFQFRHIALNKDLESLDIIYTQSAGNYFSERLINAFNENGFTGLSEVKNRTIEFV